ncbi:MAG: hypothetical protein RR413_12090 [Christensenellaceae bacterium]
MKKIIATILCFVLVFAFAGSALALGLYRTYKPNTNYYNEGTGTKTATSQFYVTKNSNCNFNGNPVKAGVNLRAMDGTANASNTVTIKSSMTSDFADYLPNYIGSVWTLALKVNLNTYATNYIVFSGNIYF